MKTESYVFKDSDTVVVCYFDAFLVSAENVRQVDFVQRKLDKNAILKDLGGPISFFEIELIWKKDVVYLSQRRLIQSANRLRNGGLKGNDKTDHSASRMDH